ELRAVARVFRPAGGKLDKGTAVFRAAVTRGRAPHGVGETGEFALHPSKLGSVLERLLLGLGDMDLLQHPVIVGTSGKARLSGHVVVDLPNPLRAVDRRVERDIGIAALGRPDDRLGADDTRDPHARMRLLQRYGPRVDDAVLVMGALPAERALARPRCNHQIMRLLKALPIVGRADAGG